MHIREATPQDHDAVWNIFKQVIAGGDTYVFSPVTPREDLGKLWFAPSMKTYVAEDGDHIAGTYILKPNQIDLGSHIANCGYMVDPEYRGRGLGKLLCEHSLDIAKTLGYRGMQFNIVVSTNESAVYLWKKIGFRIIGTIPGAFKHQVLGFVDAYIMYKEI